MTEHIVIMAGGVGSRLFPVSTPERPKQFLDLLGCGKTLIRLTYERFLAVNPDAVFWVVTSREYVHFVLEQIPEIPLSQVIAEPAMRNTAPCIALACRKIALRYPDASVIVTPADAYVPDVQSFAQSMRKALDFAASNDAIVCIGITPSGPRTEYGYIHASADGSAMPVKVSSFKEKPDHDTACSYLAEGGYWWNAGIFVWKAAVAESELRRFAPEIADVMDTISPSLYTPCEEGSLAVHFPRCPKISIDYAVMEKSDRVYVLPSGWEWSDLGSFEAIAEITGRDPRKSI